jgi:hypothetical protein
MGVVTRHQQKMERHQETKTAKGITEQINDWSNKAL